MKNYICIDGDKIKISCETAKNLKEHYGKKPELRHGDYGHYGDGHGNWWAWQRNDVLELFGSRKGTGGEAQDSWPNMIRDGNHVDDLARLGQDLEKFGMKVNHSDVVSVDIKQNEIHLIGTAFDLHFTIDGFAGFCREGLRLAATAKRKQGGDC